MVPEISQLQLGHKEHNYAELASYNSYQLSFAIFKKLYFHDLFIVNKAQVKVVKTNHFCYVIKFVCLGVHANFEVVMAKNFKSNLPSSKDRLFNDSQSFSFHDRVI